VDDFEDVRGCDWREFWSGADKENAFAAIEQAKAGHLSRFRGFTPTMKGTAKWWDVVVSPIVGPDGEVDRVLAVSRDITDQRRSEEQRELLINELNHRVKNTLASVQSISSQTLRSAQVDSRVREALDSRITSLAGAHDVLTHQNWEGASIMDIVRQAISPFKRERFRVEGPNARLAPKSSLAIAMAIHELATNALKYGALSSEAGRVVISWSLTGRDAERRIKLVWTETGGPPVSKPTSKGFGSRLIERGLAAELEGTAAIDFQKSGVIATIEGVAPETFQVAPRSL
jgi:two-component sensor histidine kinase